MKSLEGESPETRLWRGVPYGILTKCFGRAVTPRRETQPKTSIHEVAFNDNYISIGGAEQPPSHCIVPFRRGGDAVMSFLIQIVYDGSDHKFEVLTTMAQACDATEVERYNGWIELYHGERYPDYRFLARFNDFPKANTFLLFGNKASGYNRGCLMASESEFEKQSSETIVESQSVYLIWAEGTNRYKIGKSTDLKKRLKSLQTSCPYPIHLIHRIRCVNTSISDVELGLHICYSESRVNGEWFELDREAVDYIKSLETL